MAPAALSFAPAARHLRLRRVIGRFAPSLVTGLIAICAVGEDAALPPARAVLETVVAQLPREPLRVSGELTVRHRRGVVVRTVGFEMFLHWGAEPSTARYTVRDALGADLERLTVTRTAGGEAGLEYAAGAALTPAPLPDLYASVQATDISWVDLSLAFLWWPDATMVGTGEVRGRECLIVTVRPPPGEDAAVYDHVRLWIDRKLFMLLQVEAFDAEGMQLRRLWVKSLKKMGEQWMIKDLEVESAPVVQRTRLRVPEVETVTP